MVFVTTGIFMLVAAVPLSALAGYDDDYCRNPEAMARWQMAVEKNPNDMGLQTLHALWLGLCVKVEKKQITTREATILFEKARVALIKQRKSTKDQDRRQGDRL